MHVEAFIGRWTTRGGGAERANYQMFLSEFCDVIGVARPEPAGAEAARNDYVFERAVRPRGADGAGAPKRIDLYRRGAFILEAKQSRLPGAAKGLPDHPRLFDEPAALGQRSAQRGWDVMMANARRQAEAYVFLLDPEHSAPPFLLVCDVGHCIELYADFSGTGRGYAHFPDRKSFRVYLEDLRHEAVRDRLRAVWEQPASLDPARESARVTREIAGRLAAVSKSLEASHRAEEVAHFLMRCIFTMFAEDVDLLPKGEFTKVLKDCVDKPESFPPLLAELWAKMDEEDPALRYSTALRARVRHFNGSLFSGAKVFPLGREEIGELLAAAEHNWKEVDPAIFGALLEQALDKQERKRLGAHYTPRAYVQRLVDVTVMEPLREDWQAALTRAEAAKQAGDDRRAVAAARAFHKKLCATRVLDPACGTGNFLYVALELMKTLEGEVLETLARLGEPESMGLDRETVDPHQFLGLELNPRAAAIAELVIWIGYLQQHYRSRTGHPGEPILRAFRNINFGAKAGFDAVLNWDGFPVPMVVERDGRRVETYPNARRPTWPEAEFIVGNPPFIGKGSVMRSALGDSYVETLWRVHPQMNESADIVLYWWDRSAELLGRDKTVLRRFGLVTTNSISQTFNRRVLDRHLGGEKPVSLMFAVPDHPWTKATRDAAAVRIAMTVGQAGRSAGLLIETTAEGGLDSDQPRLEFRQQRGRISSDLSVGADIVGTSPLAAMSGLSWNGVMLAGRGFVLSAVEADHVRDIDVGDSRAVVRRFLNGGDLVQRRKRRFVIDFHGLTQDEARRSAPDAYQHVLANVKPERDRARDAAFRERWWLFGRARPDLREALDGIGRYIGTTETSKHRLFQFIPADVLPDHMIIAIATDSAFALAILSSRVHLSWTAVTGGTLENRPRYTKSACFDPFPFPNPSPALRARLAAAGEELDALRKAVQAEHPDITLTALYNVREKLKSGAPLDDRDEDVKRRGLVLILNELHETIDRLTLEAYGWPRPTADEDILERLVALNAERAQEEASGLVRWLRPDYQAPRVGKGVQKTGALPLAAASGVAKPAARPAFPKDRYEQPLAVEAALARAGRPLDAADVARAFGGSGSRRRERVGQALETLALYGRVTALGDGRFAASRTA